MGHGIFLGLSTVDILNFVDSYPSSNEKVKVNSQLIYGGGPATNAAVAYASFGNPTTLITGIGDHPASDLVRDDLASHSVTLIDAAANSQQLPVLSSITIDEGTGNRSVVYTNTDDRTLKSEPLSDSILEGVSLVMLDGYYLAQGYQLAEKAKHANIPVILDGGSWKEGIEKLLPLVDYAICSENFQPPGCQNTAETVDFLRSTGINNICISRGAAPLYTVTAGEVLEISTQETEVIDTLGAGDILHGAFCHFIQSTDFLDSLQKAAEIASYSCRFRGTRSWIEHYNKQKSSE